MTSAKEVIAAAMKAGVDNDGDGFSIGEKWSRTFADAILAALDAAGYVVVPREPTEAMREAARAAPLARGIGNVGIGEVYRAMIAAQESES